MPSTCFETGSLIGADLTQEARLVDQPAPGILLSLLPPCWDYKQVFPCLGILTGVLGIEHRSPYLDSKGFTGHAVSPAAGMAF